MLVGALGDSVMHTWACTAPFMADFLDQLIKLINAILIVVRSLVALCRAVTGSLLLTRLFITLIGGLLRLTIFLDLFLPLLGFCCWALLACRASWIRSSRFMTICF